MLCVPFTGFAPVQAPDAVQTVASVTVQDRVEPLPLVMELGLAEIFTVGAAAFTETVADSEAVPPAPVQVRV